MVLATGRSAKDVIATLSERYVVRDPEIVGAYVLGKDDLFALLDDVAGVVPRCFPDAPHLVLELVSDPDGEGRPDLFALIQTSLSWEEALARLEHLGEEWWLEAAARGRGLLTLDIERV